MVLLERPFSVGDTIRTGDVLGIAESIDLLAVRVRTFDNKLIRIPNEVVLKQSLINLTFYPIKRIDLELSTIYNDSLDTIKIIVADIIAQHALFLKNPEPLVKVSKLSQPDFSTETRFYISIRFWVAKEHFFTAGGTFIELLKHEFDKKQSVITVVQVNQ